ncbi:dynamin family protein [Sorangium sp. So ce542]|uniref:dynamin family protein n=1 Tax=Sorangium sp. So ce542 TaxID=3133316 RepID=UPI003F62F9DF
MHDLKHRAEQILNEYETHSRPLLEALDVRELVEIDASADVLRRALAQQRPLRIGFLGESQVGKSSIINALVSQRVLPSGGVGPLTAQATTIAFSGTPKVRVKYHARRRLNEFRFALQRYLQAIGELPAGAADAPTEAAEGGEAEGGAFSALDFSKSDEAEGGHAASDERRKVGEYLISQARLMLGVPAESSRFEVLRLVRAIAAKEDRALEAPDAYRSRIAEIRARLDASEEFSRASMSSKEFNQTLRQCAAGWLSPLVAELDVTLDLSILAESELVDLPGIGVVGDPAGRVAEEFVRTRADALVIVMRNNGLTEQVARLLETTGVITRLLFGGEGAEPSIHVAIVVTRLDDVARDRWTQGVVEARETGEPVPSRGAIFRELADQMAATVRRQVAESLLRSRDFEDLDQDQRDRRERVVRALCDAMTVVCVSAPDYLNIMEGVDDVGFLRDKADTNIPVLGEELRALGQRAAAAQAARLGKALGELEGAVLRGLEGQERARRDRGAARSEADERFREELRAAAEPLRAEAKRHRREFLSFLGEAMPQHLGKLSAKAAERAQKRLERLKIEGAKLHWATLNAALVRNGAFRGVTDIDYPAALTRAFVDVIAGSWEQAVVDEVRTAFKHLCDADADLVDALNEATSQILRTEELNITLREQRRILREQGKVSITWTQAQLEELSEDVRGKLMEVVGQPIERACRAASKAGQNRGTGARGRILDVFDSGGKEAIERAREQCMVVLNEHLGRLRRSLGNILRDNYDPVTSIFEAIVDAQAEEIARLGEQRRREQLATIRAATRRLRALTGDQAGVGAPASGSDEVAARAAPQPQLIVHAPPDSNMRDVGAGVFDDL